MDMRFKFNLFPTLLPGGKVLVFEKRIRAYSVKSPPSDRVNLLAPPLLEAGLYVTDRRVLLVIHMFRVLAGEQSQWFKVRGEPEAKESIKEINVGKRPLLGPYLEVISENPVKRWYRSPRLQARFFMKNPESVRRVITETIAKVPETTNDGNK